MSARFLVLQTDADAVDAGQDFGFVPLHENDLALELNEERGLSLVHGDEKMATACLESEDRTT